MSGGVGSSTYSTRNSTNKGMMGMVSGMDTEGMVEAMLANTQKKINTQNADKQRTTWRQEIYRDLISQISSFQNKFFNKYSTSSMFSSSFFNVMKAQSTAKAFSVTAGSSASNGKTSVKVGQLATAASLKSEKGVSAQINGEMNTAAFDKKVVLEVGGRGKAYEVEIDLEGADTAEKVAEAIKNQSGGKLDASIVDGRLTITGSGDKKAEIHVSSKSDALGLAVAGLGVGGNGAKDKDTGEISITTTANPNASVSVQVVLNGKTRDITLTANGATEAERMADLEASFQKGLDLQFGANAVKVNMQSGGKFSLDSAKGNRIQIAGGNGMTALGLKYAQSNQITEGTALKDMSFSGGKIQGSIYEFSINGVDFKFTGDDTISTMKTKIKNSTAGVELKYDDLNDQFSLVRKDTGKGYDITVEQKTGNLLGAMFGGVESGGQVIGNMLTTKGISGDSSVAGAIPGDYKSAAGATFNMIVNGEMVTIGLPEKKDNDGKVIGYTKDEARDEINKQLADRFGYVGAGKDTQAIKLVGDKLEINNGAAVTFPKTAAATGDDAAIAEAAKNDLALLFGLNKEEQNNLAKADTKLSDIGLGEIATLTGKTTLGDLTGAGGFTFNANGRLTFDGDPATLSTDLKNKLFGGEISLGTTTGSNTVVEGQNAFVNINGVDLERTDNSFTVGGLTISLTDVTGEYVKGTGAPGETVDADGYLLNADGNRIIGGDAETIGVTRDSEKVVEGVKAFVDDYNALIAKLNMLVGQKTEYRNYDPLTAEQKKDMSESEIKLWEEKAKTGLLHGDGDIESLLTEMRGVIYSKPAGSQLALFDIGIDTGKWEDQGKLTFNEDVFRKNLEENTAAVEELFTNATEGIAKKMESALTRTAGGIGVDGTLVRKAGIVGKSSEVNNELSERLRQINDRLKDLQTKYEKEKSRYWRQFNSMEQQLSNMNSQSSWLSQQFA